MRRTNQKRSLELFPNYRKPPKVQHKKFKSYFLKLELFLVVLLEACSANMATQAVPERKHLACRGTFAEYAFSTNLNSFDPKEDINAKHTINGDGQVPEVFESNIQGAVTLMASSVRTKITVPKGWYALDEGDETIIRSPDQRIRFLLHLIKSPKSFDNFRQNILTDMKTELKQDQARFSQFDLLDGSFGIEITNISTSSGRKNGMICVYTPHPKGERNQLAMSMSLTAPQEELRKYEGLLGLMLNSREIQWGYFK